jgi:hypothetical protein
MSSHAPNRRRWLGALAIGIVAVLIVGAAVILWPRGDNPPPHGPLYTLDNEGPQTSWRAWKRGDEATTRLVRLLEDDEGDEDAKGALARPIETVTAKAESGPSGDKHDYVSLSDYYWPNPDTPDGLPYVLRDGQRNPEVDSVPDRRLLRQMITDVGNLSMAYYFTRNEVYAKGTADRLKAWFINPDTRMNPHLRYAQIVKGKGPEGQGIIDALELPRVLDAMTLIEESESFSRDDLARVSNWFQDYLIWLTTSSQGSLEAAFDNNRGTWYRAQVAAIAAYLHNDALVRKVAIEGQRLIDVQIEGDGIQPLELARTNTWDYSVANLRALLRLAIPAQTVDVDLLSYKGKKGGGIEQALLYLIPYALEEKSWPHPQVPGHPAEPRLINPALALGAWAYGDTNEVIRQARRPLSPSPYLGLGLPPPWL